MANYGASQFYSGSPGLAITMVMAEPERMEAEARFLNTLQSARVLRLEGDGIAVETDDHTTRLRFTGATAAQSLSELLNVELSLVRFVGNGKEIALPANATVTLKFQDTGQLSGRSAANNYAGVFTATPDGKITIQLTIATPLAGPPELMALERVSSTRWALSGRSA